MNMAKPKEGGALVQGGMFGSADLKDEDEGPANKKLPKGLFDDPDDEKEVAKEKA